MFQGFNTKVENSSVAASSLFLDQHDKANIAVQSMLAQPHCLALVPALPASAKMLLALPEKGRRNPRLLALLAQKDPAFLTRLLCLAGSTEHSHEGAHVGTANEAIEVLGVAKSLAAMLSIAEVSPTAVASTDFSSLLFSAQQFVLRRSFTYSLTAQRLARYLGLKPEVASMLQVSCLLDSLGLCVGLYASHGSAIEIQQELSNKAAASTYVLRNSAVIKDYPLLSIYLARQWHAAGEVVEMLAPNANSMHALIVAVEWMVEAKLQNMSQQRALKEAVAQHACWVGRLRRDEIDLAVLPW
jgi:hypothetical protein